MKDKPESALARARQWRFKNKSKHRKGNRERAARWRANHPELHRERVRAAKMEMEKEVVEFPAVEPQFAIQLRAKIF